MSSEAGTPTSLLEEFQAARAKFPDSRDKIPTRPRYERQRREMTPKMYREALDRAQKGKMNLLKLMWHERAKIGVYNNEYDPQVSLAVGRRGDVGVLLMWEPEYRLPMGKKELPNKDDFRYTNKMGVWTFDGNMFTIERSRPLPQGEHALLEPTQRPGRYWETLGEVPAHQLERELIAVRSGVTERHKTLDVAPDSRWLLPAKRVEKIADKYQLVW